MKAWREECAVFGVWGDPEAARMTYLSLYAQQHRGQESTGIVSLHEGGHISHKGMGLVGDVFKEQDLIRLEGLAAIGHNRYSTAGGSNHLNIQPLTAQLMTGPVALAHNGNIVNGDVLRAELRISGIDFSGDNGHRMSSAHVGEASIERCDRLFERCFAPIGGRLQHGFAHA